MTAKTLGPIVSSAHLATGAMPALSEVEFGMILAMHGFNRWMVRCMTAAGVEGMGPLDVLVLHSVNHRGRAKTLADICLVLNVEDTHTVTYALKKLERAGLIQGSRKGKEKTIEITKAGEAACTAYREIREALLTGPASETGLSPKALSETASLLRTLAGQYDQAARSAASL